MSDVNYAKLCQRAYAGVPTFGTPDGPRVFKDTVNGHVTYCFPGSRSLQDWVLDMIAVPFDEIETANVYDLGHLHLGFCQRARNCKQLIDADLLSGVDYAFCGHSLGGAIALIMGALIKAEGGKPPVEIVTFGAPRAGFKRYAAFIRSIPIRQYRFGADPVTLVPTHPFVHAREPLIRIGEPIKGGDLFVNHGIVNYIGQLDNG